MKLVITSNHGSDRHTILADVRVREGQAPGYVPFLTRHADLAGLLSTGVFPTDGGRRGAARAADPNDFGDSNTSVRYEPNWCGALVGVNVNDTRGFVLAYAHYGRGLILYDGLDFDQFTHAAYRHHVGRQLLLPFDSDDLRCTTRLAPFVVSSDALLANRPVQPGETCTYPLTVAANRADYKGEIKLSLPVPPGLRGVKYRFNPEVVNLGIEAKSSLTVTMTAKLPETLRIAVHGTAADAGATLCLAARERRTGTLSVVLITDGEESCGGDFAGATNTLRQPGLDLRLSIVGFTLKGQQAKLQLGAIAAATGGSYYSAQDGAALTRALVAATISRFPYSVLSASGAVVARGEAGDAGQELPPGDCRVVVLAGDEELALQPVSVSIAGSVTVRVVRKDNRFVLER